MALLARYKFDEGSGTALIDSGPNALSGVYVGSPSWSSSSGAAPYLLGNSNSIILNGTTQYATVARSTILEPVNAITVALWINLSSTVDAWYMGKGLSHDLSYGFGKGVNTAGQVGFYAGRNGSLLGAEFSAAVLSTGNWYHLAGTFDGTYLRVYFNGNLQATTNYTLAPLYYGDGPTSLIIGGFMNNNVPTAEYFGKFDDLRIYDFCMPPFQIKHLAAGYDGDCWESGYLTM